MKITSELDSVFKNLVCQNFAVIIFDAKLNIIEFNERFEENYAREFHKKIKGMNIKDLGLSLSDPSLAISLDFDRFIKEISKGKNWKGELVLNMQKGEKVYIEALFYPLMQDKKLRSIIFCFNSISKQKQLEKNLKIQNERMDLVFKGSNIGLWDWNPKTNEVFFNDQWCLMLGYQPSEVKPQLSSWEELVHPEDIADCFEDIGAHVAGKTSMYQNVHRMKHKDGTWRYILDKGRVFEWDQEGHPIRFSGTHNDITEQVKSERFFNDISASAKIGAWSYELKTNTIYWSAMTYKIHEIEDTSFRPDVESGISFYYEEDRKKITEAFENCLQHQVGYDLELRIKTAKGHIKWVRAIGNPEVYQDQVISVVGTFQDIDKRKQLEMQLQQKQERLELALQASSIGVWELNNQTGELIWDERMLNIYGVTRDEFPGHYDDWHSFLHPDDIEQVSQSYQYSIEQQQDFRETFRIIHKKTNEIRHINAIANLFFDDKGGMLHAVGVNWDVTEQVQLLEQARNAKLKAQNALETRSRFLANMSHEIRTPLNSIIGMSELVLESKLNDEQKEQVELINYSGEMLLYLINDILDFSKLDAGKVELFKHSFSVEKFVQNIFKMIQTGKQKKKIDFLFEIDPKVPKNILTDEHRLRQVVVNLLSNATKFTHEGYVKLEVKLRQEAANECQVEFIVSDTGIGVKRSKLNKLFDAFEQADSSLTRKYGGTGLGLAISKELVHMLGGEIKVESDFGFGSRFSFFIKTKKAKAKAVAEPIDVYTYDLSQIDMQFLLVEDNVINQKLMSAMFKKLNLALDIASNGKEALEKLDGKNYDLIFMDMQMPVMDGLTATKLIRQTYLEGPYIVAMTANAFDEDRKECLRAGMNDFLTKPLKKETLIRTIIEFSQKKSQKLVS